MKGSSKDQFNISAEKELQNRIKGYDLTENEAEQIWISIPERDNQIAENDQYFEENWEQLQSEEYNRLLTEERPNPQLNMTRAGHNQRAALLQQAYNNVESKMVGKQAEINQNWDNKIDNILNQAQEQGRGPKSEMQQDFQKAHDHENDHENGR